jgi:hypothetical protein
MIYPPVKISHCNTQTTSILKFSKLKQKIKEVLDELKKPRILDPVI